MSSPSKPPGGDERRARLIGFGERSIHKSYYPELRRRLDELEHFRALLNQSRDVIVLIEWETERIADVTGQAEELLGVGSAELIGAPVRTILPRESVERVFQQTQSGEESLTLETSMASPSGPVPVEMAVRVGEFSGGVYAIAVLRDIRERKEAELALRRAEERYRSIFENAAEGLFRSDGKRFQSANPSLARILGYNGPEQLIREVTDLRRDILVDPADFERLESILLKQGAFTNRELRLRRRDGATIFGAVSMRLIAPSETSFRVEGSVIDITKRKTAEEALIRHREQLERRVDERTHDLQRANEMLRGEVEQRFAAEMQYKEAKEAAEQANHAKTEFLSMVSHELRTPLTSVLGFAKIIRRRLAKTIVPQLTPDDPAVVKAVGQVQSDLEIIIAEGQRLTELINDVLDVSKLEAGKVVYRDEPVSVADVIHHATKATASLFRQKRLELVVSVPEDLPPVHGDEDRLIQVVINLLSNAVKFTPSGQVVCKAIREDGMVRVSVVDTGIGISPDDQQLIFEKFRQIGDTLTDRPRGTGLGLAISKQIIEHHGGVMTVKSEVGCGSELSFTLPLGG